MSTSTGKKTREQTENGEQNAHKELSDSLPEEMGNGDTVIFSTLIPMMKDVYVLKICRLVCKSWNQFACRALRKLPRVYFPVYEFVPRATHAHFRVLLDNQLLGLPSPFRKFKVETEELEDAHFLRFLKYLRETTSDFEMDLRISSALKVDQAELQRVLTSNQHKVQITKLELCCYDYDLSEVTEGPPDPSLFQLENIRLPYLRKFVIHGEALSNDRVAVFCETLCHYSLFLKTLGISSVPIKNLRKIMQPGGMASVEELQLDVFGMFSLDNCNYVCARIMEISCLKKLEVYPPKMETAYWFHRGFETVIGHFADSLESLKGNYLPGFSDKSFPKLREIKYESFEEFVISHPVERYPLLRKVTFGFQNGNNFNYPTIAEEQSTGVEVLSLKPSTTADPDVIMKFICVAGMLYPNVSKFSIGYWGRMRLGAETEFDQAMLSVICKSFPKLTALKLLVDVRDDRVLSGLRVNVDDWLEEGWPPEKIPRETSLLDFKGLEKLTLGPKVEMTRDLFIHCLSKISKLEYLAFYSIGLDEDVSATDIRDSVGHLRRIVVCVFENLRSDAADKQWLKEMERLRTMVPGVVDIKIVKLGSSAERFLD